MGSKPFVKITAPTAADVCAHVELDEPARALLDPAHTPQAYVGTLAGAQQWRDAARFLAFALPPREAVWWACLCARSVMSAESAPIALAALQAAEAWAYQPTEENRRGAEAAAMSDGALEHAAGWAAMSAFWSGGSLGPAENPVVAPEPTLAAKAVQAALLIASVAEPPEQEPERLQAFLAWGEDIAAGGDGSG